MKKAFKVTVSVTMVLMIVCSCIMPTFASMTKTDKFILTNYKQTGNGASDIANIALAQEGLTEAVLDYDKSWCAAFVSDCAEIAGQSGAIPRNAGVNELKSAVLKAGGDEITDLKNVKKGDLCFVDWYGDGGGSDFDHVEIVYQDAVGDKVYTIGGNTGANVDSVYRHDPINSSWHLNNGIILCIVRPDYKNSENNETGKCGDNVTYSFDESTGTLTVSGVGEMYDFTDMLCWSNYKDLIKTVIIGEGVTSIGGWAFDKCTNLTSVTIPESVTNIKSYAFHETALYKDSSNWENDVLYIGNHLIDAKETISGEYEIKNGTKTIAEQAFQDCTNLTSVIIPESMTNIGGWAFHNCTSLENISISDNVTSIGWFAFWDCVSLVNVIIPNKVTRIEYYTFGGCESLISVSISNSVTIIDTYAFYDCKSLKDVYYNGSETEWLQIHIADYYGGNDCLFNATIHYNYTEKEPTFFEKIISFFKQIISFFASLFAF